MIQKFGELQHLHLELSSKCNARCPRCPRNFYGFPYPDDFEQVNIDLQQLKELIPLDTLAGIKEILINGNYGDFVMNTQALDIVAWLSDNQAPGGIIKISTNGSARDRKFWASLASISNVEVWFCIDGLRDTHHLYRQDTDFDTILDNASEFIRCGGRARWHYTIFPHNQHQVDRARDLAQSLGFSDFETRVNRRFDGPVYDRNGRKVFVIGPRDPGELPESVDIQYVKSIKPTWKPQERTDINCEAAQQKSAYVSAAGILAPCCYLDLSRATNLYGHTPARDKYQDLLLPKIQSLASSESWFPEIVESWKKDPHAVCQVFCGRNPKHDSCH